MSKNIFNRTVKTNIILYPTDGTGRDYYISYNNAGFWKDNVKRIIPKEKHVSKPFANFHSLRRIPPTWKYHADGTGRDGYVLHDYGGFIHRFDPIDRNNSYLRSSNDDIMSKTHYKKNFLSKDEILYRHKLNQIQNGLVKRLYYKPKRELKFLYKDNSAPNIFNENKFDSIRNNNNYINNDNEQNNMNNGQYNGDKGFMDNSQVRNNLYDEKKNDEDNYYNGRNFDRSNSFKRFRVRCLANKIDDRIYHYPFNQFTYDKNKIENFDNL